MGRRTVILLTLMNFVVACVEYSILFVLNTSYFYNKSSLNVPVLAWYLIIGLANLTGTSIIIIIIITLFKCQSSSALALIGDTFQARIGIWKCWFLRRGENRSTWGKTSRSREENQQQTQPTYDTGSGNRTWDSLVGGERSHHCAIPAPQKKYFKPCIYCTCKHNVR